MAEKEKKRSIFAKIRNYFIAGVVVLIPIGITLYLTLFIVSISSLTWVIRMACFIPITFFNRWA